MYYRALDNGPRRYARTGWMYEQNGADPFVPIGNVEGPLVAGLAAAGKVVVVDVSGLTLELMMMSKGVAEYAEPPADLPVNNGIGYYGPGRLTGRIHYPFDREDPRYPLVQSVN